VETVFESRHVIEYAINPPTQRELRMIILGKSGILPTLLIKIPVAAMLLLGSVFCARSETLVRVSDFGAVPGDGICDAVQIRAAVASAAGLSGVRVVFDAGVYNLAEA